MSQRIRWFGITPSEISLKKYTEAMLSSQYISGKDKGFQLEEVRRDYVTGNYIERIEWDDFIEDPMGDKIDIHRIELRQTKFRLTNKKPELEIYDAPRTLRNFVNQLSNCVGTSIRLLETLIDPNFWLGEIEKLGYKSTVVIVNFDGLTISNNASASIIIEGSEDVRKFLEQFTENKTVRIVKIVALLSGDREGKVELLDKGRSRIIQGDEHILNIVRNALRVSIK